jgi:serine/threonine-protein kinase
MLTRQNHDTIPLRRKRVDVTQPSLVSAQGNIYTLKAPSVWIGRPTKGFRPDINLLELEEDPANPSSSRRHAELFQEGNKNFFLRPRPTLNGTFVNGTEIAHNQNHILKEGDLLRFGDVELTFRLPH